MKSTMRALVLTDTGPTLEDTYPVPVLLPGDALIRMRLAGICATDLELWAGYKGGYRGILGHEFVGEVVDAPEQPHWIGRRVVGEINAGCGECGLCRGGLGKHCRSRTTLGIARRDGAFAEYLTLPIANLLSVPDEISDEQAVFAEPLAAALQILEQYALRPSEKVYVLGDGRLGLLVAQVLARPGVDLVALGRTESKLSILAKRGIATVRVDNSAILEALLDQPAHLVVEVTGSPTGFALARRLVRPGGTLILKSTFAQGLADFDISSLVVDEITLMGSRCGPFAPALRLLRNGAVEVESLIHARYPLHEAVAALTYAGQKGVLKVLIEGAIA